MATLFQTDLNTTRNQKTEPKHYLLLALVLLLSFFFFPLLICLIPVAVVVGKGSKDGPFLVAIPVVLSLATVVVFWWTVPLYFAVATGVTTLSRFTAAIASVFVVTTLANFVEPQQRQIARFLRWDVSVVLFCYLCVPIESLMITLVIVFLLKGFRFWLSKQCSTPFTKGDKNLRVMLSGDSFYPKLDGPQIFTTNTIKQLVSRGDAVHVYTSIKGDPVLFGATVDRGPGITGAYPGHSLTVPTINFLWALIKFKPSIVHLFDETIANCFFQVTCWFLDIPSIFSHHSRVDLYAGYSVGIFSVLGPACVRLLYKILFPTASGHLLLDKSQEKQPWFAGQKHVRFWNSGCDLDNFNPKWRSEETRKKLSQGRPDLPLVLFVGRLANEKQVHLIPDLIKITNRDGERCRFVIVGSGPSLDELKDELKGRDDVILTGALKGEELFRAYASCDIFFSPTITGTADLVFFESQAAGLAVCGPRAVAVPYVVYEGEHGHLYDPLDMESASEALQKILLNYQKLGAQARKNAEQKFSWKSVTEEAIGFYHEILEQRLK